MKRNTRSGSLPYTKTWLGVRPSGSSSETTPKDTTGEKRSKKEQILKNNPTDSQLLQNMRDINYELRSKSDFKKPHEEIVTTSSNDEARESQDEIRDTRTSPDVAGVKSSLADDTTKPAKKVTKKDTSTPLYYTLEPQPSATGNGDHAESVNQQQEEQGSKMSPSSRENQDETYENTTGINRSVGDAHYSQTKRQSFKIVSSSKRGASAAADEKVRSNTWNARELAKQRKKPQQGQEKDGRYEDVAMMADMLDHTDDVMPPSDGNDVRAAEADGSYSLLSRSLEMGIESNGNNGNKFELPGYQKLAGGQEV